MYCSLTLLIQVLFILGGLFTSGHFSENLAVLENMHLSPALLLIVKATLAFPFCFHFVNGIRHLVSIILHDARCLLIFVISLNNPVTDFILYCQTVSQHMCTDLMSVVILCKIGANAAHLHVSHHELPDIHVDS